MFEMRFRARMRDVVERRSTDKCKYRECEVASPTSTSRLRDRDNVLMRRHVRVGSSRRMRTVMIDWHAFSQH
jgi:hypothetical protein